MKELISNSTMNSKLKFNGVRDQILDEEVCRKNLSKAIISNSTLNFGIKGWSYEMNSNQGNGWSNSKNKWANSKSWQNVECWNYGLSSHIKKNCQSLKNDENKKDTTNVAIEEVLLEIQNYSIPWP